MQKTGKRAAALFASGYTGAVVVFLVELSVSYLASPKRWEAPLPGEFLCHLFLAFVSTALAFSKTWQTLSSRNEGEDWQMYLDGFTDACMVELFVSIVSRGIGAHGA